MITRDTAFMVGSRVYGAPRPDSDIDIVVPMSPELCAKLYELAEQDPNGPLHFGILNVIPATSDEQYQAWLFGLSDVLAEKVLTDKPVTMERAREIFRSYDAIHGTPSGRANEVAA